MATRLALVVSLIVIVNASSPFTSKYCDDRGGCNCVCDWANPNSCSLDDGSCCFSCCCADRKIETYCPSVSDLSGEGNAKLQDQGWSLTGGGHGATKASFNLLGGSVEFDIDVTGGHVGVNQNIYTISPYGIGAGGFTQRNYCDGAKPYGDQWCVEVDWIESNGNCMGQSTLHDVPGPGDNGCTAWGCTTTYYYNGRTSFHMKITYDANGVWNTYRDGQHISPWSLHPTPSNSDWATLVKYYSERGAVIYSSQWVGWVPVGNCGQSGDLNSSHFSIKNLRITGSVVQGPKPRLCSGFLE